MKITTEKFLQDDVNNFFNKISDCIGKNLSKSKNTINLVSPDWDSYNTSKSILCKIDDIHYVCLKRYDENFHFAKQEVLTSKIKEHTITGVTIEIEIYSKKSRVSNRLGRKTLSDD